MQRGKKEKEKRGMQKLNHEEKKAGKLIKAREKQESSSHVR